MLNFSESFKTQILSHIVLVSAFIKKYEYYLQRTWKYHTNFQNFFKVGADIIVIYNDCYKIVLLK